MAFYEEERSVLEKKIGRRFPLAILILMAIVALTYSGYSDVARELVIAFGIIMSAYYKDVGQEKNTIKMINGEMNNATND